MEDRDEQERLMTISEIVVPPSLQKKGPDPDKMAAARKRLAVGVPLLPMRVAVVEGRYVLQLGYETYLLLQEKRIGQHPVVVLPEPKHKIRTNRQGRVYQAGDQQVACALCGGHLLEKNGREFKDLTVCPDCYHARTFTDRRYPIEEWGFAGTQEAVQQFIDITGVPAAEAPLLVRLSTVVGCLFTYQEGGRRRIYSQDRLRFFLEDQIVVKVKAHPDFQPPYKDLTEFMRICRDLRRRFGTAESPRVKLSGTIYQEADAAVSPSNILLPDTTFTLRARVERSAARGSYSGATSHTTDATTAQKASVTPGSPAASSVVSSPRNATLQVSMVSSSRVLPPEWVTKVQGTAYWFYQEPDGGQWAARVANGTVSVTSSVMGWSELSFTHADLLNELPALGALLAHIGSGLIEGQVTREQTVPIRRWVLSPAEALWLIGVFYSALPLIQENGALAMERQ